MPEFFRDAHTCKLDLMLHTIASYRMQVNDQIIEVDDKSLVGVTQAYAASVLRNTSGAVRFVSPVTVT